MEHVKVETATSDDRGRISDILYKEDVEHVAIIETHQGGVIRGNHYHKESTQKIFMTKGSLRYWYQPYDESEPVKSVLLKEYEMITTPPFEVHSLEMLEPSQFIVFSSGTRGGKDYEVDTYRDRVILTPEMMGQ